MMYFISIVLLFIISHTTIAGQAIQDDKIVQNLTIGFVPSRNINTVQLSAKKIAEFLSKETGYNVQAITVSNYASIVFGMKAKRIDLAFVGPLNYLILHKNTGAYPLTSSVRKGLNGFYSIVVVRNDSGINTMQDLKGKKFAFGDALSTSSTVYPKKMLQEAGLNIKKDIKSVRIGNTSAIVLAVMQGSVDAGAIYNDARTNSEVLKQFPNILTDTKIIMTSELIPSDLQIVGKHISNKQAQILQQALIKISQNSESQKVLKSMYGIDKLTPSIDSDYNEFRKIISAINPELL